jgi:hypothetical protein
MSSDEDDRSIGDIEREMESEAERMQRGLDDLDARVEDAAKKAQHTGEHAELPEDEAVEAVAGDASERSTSSDDPTSAVGDPEKAED